jgi:hypothetical protein
MKKRFLFYLASLLFLSCSDENMLELDHPEAKTELHNALHSDVEIAFGIDFEYRTKKIKPGMSQPYGRPFYYMQDLPWNEVTLISMRFADGKVKSDWNCSSFIYSPSLFAICGEDSVSVFLKENYTSHLEGNDTIYRYYIGINDSLEAY